MYRLAECRAGQTLFVAMDPRSRRVRMESRSDTIARLRKRRESGEIDEFNHVVLSFLEGSEISIERAFEEADRLASESSLD